MIERAVGLVIFEYLFILHCGTVLFIPVAEQRRLQTEDIENNIRKRLPAAIRRRYLFMFVIAVFKARRHTQKRFLFHIHAIEI